MDYSHDSEFWMDGVGAIESNPFAFEFIFFPFDEPKMGKQIVVITCMKDGKYYFHPGWIAGPVEQTSIDDKTHIDNAHKGIQFYDLTGRLLTSPRTRGIYIQNGKKYVVK